MNFDFLPKNQYSTYVKTDGSIQLTIECVHHGASYLYFKNESNERIRIPDGIKVYTYDSENSKKRILLNKMNENGEYDGYALCYTDKYDIEWEGKILLKLNPKRSWTISEYL